MPDQIDPDSSNEWWTAADIAEYFNIQRTTVAAWRRAGKIPKPNGKIGHTWIWKSSQIIDWGKRRTQPKGGRKTHPGNPDPNSEWWRVSDVAAYLRVKPGTVSSYRSRGQMPEPDIQVPHSPLWKPARIIEWHTARQHTAHKKHPGQHAP